MNTHIESANTRMKAASILTLAAGMFFLSSAALEAQIGLAVEGRTGVTFPQGDLSDFGGEAGLSLGAEVQVNLHQHFTVYGGFYRHGFSCETACTMGSDPRSVGLNGGLKVNLHNPGDVNLWARGGVVSNKMETDAGANNRELGYELGLGADVPIASRIALVPHVGYISHKASESFRPQFFTLGLGIHFHIN
ncbi:MAG: outer membrane beta-barrel protein [Gemmatimonadota bacterium]